MQGLKLSLNTSKLAMLLFIIGLSGISFAGYSAVRSIVLLNGLHAEGTIEEIITSQSLRGILYRQPLISFTDSQGQKNTVISSHCMSCRVGNKVDLVYPPDTPNMAKINNFETLWLPVIGGGVIGWYYALL